MYVSEKHKFVYLGNCKAGSSTVIIAIEQEYDAVGVPAFNESQPEPYAWPIGAHHAIFLPEKYKDYFVFTTVRNPFNREISKFNFLPTRREIYTFIGGMTFDEYLAWVAKKEITGNWRYDYWKRTQREIIFDQPIRDNCVPVRVDRFIQCERLADEFYDLPFVNKKSPFIESYNNSAPENKVEKFPEHLADIVRTSFKEDFEMFGYSTEIPNYNWVAATGRFDDWGYKTNSTIPQEEIDRMMAKKRRMICM